MQSPRSLARLLLRGRQQPTSPPLLAIITCWCVCVCLLWLSVCLSVRVKRRRRDNLRKGPLTSASSSYPTPSLHVHPELSLPPPVSYVGLDLLSCCPLFASTGPGQPGLSVEIPSSRLRYA